MLYLTEIKTNVIGDLHGRHLESQSAMHYGSCGHRENPNKTFHVQGAKLIIISKNDYIYHTYRLNIRLDLSHDTFGLLRSSLLAEIFSKTFCPFFNY